MVVGPIPAEVTEVRVNDLAVQPIDESNGVRRVSFTQTYDDYQHAKSSGMVIFQFLSSDGTVLNNGTAAAGACEMICIFPSCPQPAELTLEQYDITPLGYFSTFQYTCLTCEGGGFLRKICT